VAALLLLPREPLLSHLHLPTLSHAVCRLLASRSRRGLFPPSPNATVKEQGGRAAQQQQAAAPGGERVGVR
jgi:hypothetical protein